MCCFRLFCVVSNSFRRLVDAQCALSFQDVLDCCEFRIFSVLLRILMCFKLFWGVSSLFQVVTLDISICLRCANLSRLLLFLFGQIALACETSA